MTTSVSFVQACVTYLVCVCTFSVCSYMYILPLAIHSIDNCKYSSLHETSSGVENTQKNRADWLERLIINFPYKTEL